mmetsp:Transcript_5167/g.7160  ORF Transcript_5167/g.7160 Transcript_5167/m.7160 type:complete len:124 (+) Transcript_5167:2483-2854(+)
MSSHQRLHSEMLSCLASFSAGGHQNRRLCLFQVWMSFSSAIALQHFFHDLSLFPQMHHVQVLLLVEGLDHFQNEVVGVWKEEEVPFSSFLLLPSVFNAPGWCNIFKTRFCLNYGNVGRWQDND